MQTNLCVGFYLTAKKNKQQSICVCVTPAGRLLFEHDKMGTLTHILFKEFQRSRGSFFFA